MRSINNFMFRFFNGIKEIISNRKKLILFICIVLFINILNALEFVYYAIFPRNIVSEVLFAITEPLTIIIIITLFGIPLKTKRISKGFYKIGFYNKVNEIPQLLSRKHLSKDTDIIVYTFKSPYLSLADWEKAKERIETIIGYDIMKIDFGTTSTIIKIYAVDLDKYFSKTILWNNNDLISDDCTLLLGVSAFEKVTINLNHVPHSLIAGNTGSGKSTIFKLFLWQCLLKNMKVYIADFKGGLDFGNVWHKKTRIIINEKEFLDTLISIKSELKRRTDILVSSGCRDIEQYNNQNNKKLNRIIIACDEVAELLDKTGLKKSTDKTRLELMEKIEEHIMSIARLGRAFGIHLLLSTQRPSSDLINGQIKSNLGNRICGSADKILSQMVLDNTSAFDKIPHNSKGVFITQNGTLFKAYLLNESNLRIKEHSENEI